MCLAIPTRILSIEDQQGVVELGGVRRTISLVLTPEARVGDYAIVHTGFAINILDEEDAQETLRLFEEMAALDQESSKDGEAEA